MFGTETVFSAFKTDPAGFSVILKNIATICSEEVDGKQKFQGIDNFRNLTDFIGKDAVWAGLKLDSPTGIYYGIAGLGEIASMGMDTFLPILGDLTALFGKESVVSACSQNLFFLVLSGKEISELKNAGYMDELARVINFIGQDAVSNNFVKAPTKTVRALSEIINLGLVDIVGELSAFLGKDAVSAAFSKDPMGFVQKLEDLFLKHYRYRAE